MRIGVRELSLHERSRVLRCGGERRRAPWPVARYAESRLRAANMRAFVQRHPAASYFLLAIVLSWGGIVAVIWPGSIPASAAEAERLFVPVYLAMLVGPSVGGLAIAALTGGGIGLRAYRERLFAWRVAAGWYAVSAAHCADRDRARAARPVSRLSRVRAGDPVGSDLSGAAGPIHAASTLALLVTGLAVGIGAGVFEELGWTGVAVPKMLTRHGCW